MRAAMLQAKLMDKRSRLTVNDHIFIVDDI